MVSVFKTQKPKNQWFWWFAHFVAYSAYSNCSGSPYLCHIFPYTKKKSKETFLVFIFYFCFNINHLCHIFHSWSNSSFCTAFFEFKTWQAYQRQRAAHHPSATEQSDNISFCSLVHGVTHTSTLCSTCVIHTKEDFSTSSCQDVQLCCQQSNHSIYHLIISVDP